MAGVFDIELHDAENAVVDDSDDDAIEVEEVKILMADSPALFWELKPAQFWAHILPVSLAENSLSLITKTLFLQKFIRQDHFQTYFP